MAAEFYPLDKEMWFFQGGNEVEATQLQQHLPDVLEMLAYEVLHLLPQVVPVGAHEDIVHVALG